MDILKVAMYSTPSSVPACLFLFNFIASIESYNVLKMAHRLGKKDTSSILCKLIYLEHVLRSASEILR